MIQAVRQVRSSSLHRRAPSKPPRFPATRRPYMAGRFSCGPLTHPREDRGLSSGPSLSPSEIDVKPKMHCIRMICMARDQPFWTITSAKRCGRAVLEARRAPAPYPDPRHVPGCIVGSLSFSLGTRIFLNVPGGFRAMRLRQKIDSSSSCPGGCRSMALHTKAQDGSPFLLPSDLPTSDAG